MFRFLPAAAIAATKGSETTSKSAMWLELAKNPTAEPKLLSGYGYQADPAVGLAT
jgi:hypothetical protein